MHLNPHKAFEAEYKNEPNLFASSLIRYVLTNKAVCNQFDGKKNFTLISNKE